MVTPQRRERIAQIHRDLEQYSYYELLNIDANAAADDVRQAFHRMALGLHPDRYQAAADPALQQQVYAIYKRITEGYRVLMEPQLRREYDDALQLGQRRLVKTEREKTVPQRKADSIANPQARKYFTMAQEAERQGDKKKAKLYYKFAADLGGEDPVIKARLEALQEG
ncbi:MAG: DnaJ domain-containing protein [Proteobacteria bacterium]|jgi:DnaJ-class molecular chaperone|nr:DnaJ domain-containing protein [Pseudomonadota bacterium]